MVLFVEDEQIRPKSYYFLNFIGITKSTTTNFFIFHFFFVLKNSKPALMSQIYKIYLK